MDDLQIACACAATGVRAGRAIRAALQELPPAQRATPSASPLKPVVRELARYVDRLGDTIGIEHLEQLARRTGLRIDLVVDPGSGTVRSIGSSGGDPRAIFAYMDAVDGTIKIGGLGNDLRGRRLRVANDGGWAAALAFTLPTARSLDRLRVGDFGVAAVVDGNPPRYRAYPSELAVVPGPGGPAAHDVGDAADWNGGPPPGPRVFTSTNTTLGQSMVYLDSFQAFDRETRQPGDEELVVELYRLLINRHEGGAFDVLRQYANLSALQRVLLGWRDGEEWIESQGGGFVVVNENMFNLVPAVAVVAAAGGRCVDFDGRPLRERRLRDDRTSIVLAANDELARALVAIVDTARRRVREREGRA
jgi:hypothetical protein